MLWLTPHHHRESDMRAIILIIAVAVLAGCASPQEASLTQSSTPKELSTPYYSRNLHVLAADNYPIERLFLPESFRLVGNNRTEEAALFSFGDKEAKFINVVYLTNEALDKLLPKSRLEAKDRLKGVNIDFAYSRGAYADIIMKVNRAPLNAPGCAVSISLIMLKEQNPGAIAVIYVEGQECSAAGRLSNELKRDLKVRVYELLGLD